MCTIVYVVYYYYYYYYNVVLWYQPSLQPIMVRGSVCLQSKGRL